MTLHCKLTITVFLSHINDTLTVQVVILTLLPDLIEYSAIISINVLKDVRIKLGSECRIYVHEPF